MKIYRRTENVGAMTRITEVDDDGNYSKECSWTDGMITDFYKSTLAGMGWESLESFLAVRPGFALVQK